MYHFLTAAVSATATVIVLWTSDIVAEKWKPNIPEARMLIAHEARDVEGKVAWSVEMRRGSGFPDTHVAKSNELGQLCNKLAGGK